MVNVRIIVLTGSPYCHIKHHLLRNQAPLKLADVPYETWEVSPNTDTTTFAPILDQELLDIEEKYTEDSTVLYFISWRSGHTCPHLMDKAHQVLIFSNSEEQSYLNALHQRASLGDLPQLWEETCVGIKNVQPNESIYFIDADRDANQVEYTFFQIIKGEWRQDRRNCLMSYEQIHYRHSEPAQRRTNKYAETLRRNFIGQASRKAETALRYYLMPLSDAQNHSLQERMNTVEKVHTLILNSYKPNEESQVYFRVFVTTSMYLEGLEEKCQFVPVLVNMAFEIIDIIQDAKDGNMEEGRTPQEMYHEHKKTLVRYMIDPSDHMQKVCLLRICDLLVKIASHFYFRHELFVHRPFFTLVLRLLEIGKMMPNCGMVGSQLLRLPLTADHKRYGIQFFEVKGEMKKPISVVFAELSLYFVSYLFGTPSTSEEQVQLIDEYYSFVREAYHFHALHFLLKGSPDHCSPLDMSMAKRFISAADRSLSVGHSVITSIFCDYLSMMIKYGTKEVSTYIMKRHAQLLGLASRCIASLVERDELRGPAFKRATEFYSTIILEINRDTNQDQGEGEEAETNVMDEDNEIMTTEEIEDEDVSMEVDLVPTTSLLEGMKRLRYRSTCTSLPNEGQANANRTFQMGKMKLDLDIALDRIDQQEDVLRDMKRDADELRDTLNRTVEESQRKEEENRKLNQQMSMKQNEVDQLKRLMKKETKKAIDQHKMEGEPRDMTSEATKEIDLEKKVSREEAKRMIRELKRERDELKGMRKSICGSLKHLGADLYSSPIHFLHELVQNADDNRYSPDITPTLTLLVNEGYIIVRNNEMGFLPKDVQSICSIAVTTKTGGVHIGQKGLGFKSIFSCTDEPTIVSGPWSFGFRLPGVDHLSYITPIWVEGEEMKGLPLSEGETNIHLPLRDALKDTDFIDQVVSTMTQDLLLNLRQIRVIHLVDERNGRQVHLQRESQPISVEKNISSYESIEAYRLNVRSEVSNQASTSEEFIVYEAQLAVPEYLKVEETSRSSRNETRILLAFLTNPSTTPDKERTFPVFSFLPVQDIGLKFVVNCDWVLVTSRESVRENAWNTWLRDQSADLFLYVVHRDRNIRKILFDILPNQTVEMTAWWKSFVDRIQRGIQSILPSLLSVDGRDQKKLVLRNRTIEAILPLSISRHLLRDLTIVAPESQQTETSISRYLPSLSMTDVLSSLPERGDEENELYHYASTQNQDWWSRFFQIVNEEIQSNQLKDVQSIAKDKPLFIIDSETKKRHFIERDVFPFLGNIETWRQNIVMLKTESAAEDNFMVKTMGYTRMTEDLYASILSNIHLENPLKPGTKEQVKRDLTFFRDHPQLTQKYVKEGSGNLSVPLVDGSFLPISDTFLITCLSVPLSLPSSHQSRVISSFYNETSLVETLSWELFLLRMGIRLSGSSVPMGTLSPMKSMREDDIKMATNILKEISHRSEPGLTELISSLPIVDSSGSQVKISNTIDKSIVRDEFPHIEIPPNARELCTLLGVTMEADVTLCHKALINLVTQRITDREVYGRWLAQLRWQVQNITEADVKTMNKSPLLCLYANGKPVFLSLRDIYVCRGKGREEEEFNKIACQLGGACISLDHNSIYWPFVDILTPLGCPTQFDIGSLFDTLKRMMKDDRYFEKIGTGRHLLTSSGFESFWSVYKLIEDNLRNKCGKDHPSETKGRIDWKWRESLYHTVPDMKNLLEERGKNIDELIIIGHDKMIMDHRMASEFHRCFASVEPAIVDSITFHNPEIVFVEHSMARDFPFFIAALRIEYVELRSITMISHSTSNMEVVMTTMTEKFSHAYGDFIQVLQSKFISASILFSKKIPLRMNPSLDQDLESLTASSDQVKHNIRINIPFLVWPNHWMICAAKFLDSNNAKSALFAQALSSLLQQNRSQLPNDADDVARAATEGCVLNSNVVWEEAAHGPTAVNTEEMIFPPSNISIGDVYFTGGVNGADQYNSSGRETGTIDEDVIQQNQDNNLGFDVGQVRFDLIGQDAIFRSRLRETIDEEGRLKFEDRFKGDHPKIVTDEDITAQKRSGFLAEHFVCVWFSQIYGPSFSPYINWVSSNRMQLYPESTRGVNDAAGYDFEILDTKQIFGTSQKTVKKILVEVKGTSGFWDGSFFLSDNEKKRRDRARENSNTEAYVIVMVEFTGDSRRIQIADIIHWSEDDRCISLTPQSYTAKRLFSATQKLPKTNLTIEDKREPSTSSREENESEEGKRKGRSNKKAKQEGDVPEGKIASLKQTYGFIFMQGHKGNIFFTANAVEQNGFQHLREGERVKLTAPIQGQKGWMTKWVKSCE
ncbi:hypothetical protein PROFUN_09128 [Planoprotostelium fungivorum]|uniref:Sacsin/Nov domain-containing protein n=1 Tax=Planoprotostelium fungivorum TaxID=1890364 RepID=A0A2P6NI17_9EUKA|nr:hypothetical protein PROFUN_09128 [Planoprotostelium fungivorum]